MGFDCVRLLLVASLAMMVSGVVTAAPEPQFQLTGDRLVAPPPPGAERLPTILDVAPFGLKENDVDALIDFYEREVGPLQAMSDRNGYERVIKRVEELSWPVRKGDYMDPDDFMGAGELAVRVLVPEPPVHDVCQVEPVFVNLRTAASTNPGKDYSDVDEMCRRYAHLFSAFYLNNEDEVLFREYEERAGDPLNQGQADQRDRHEAMAQKMETLMSQGRMQEAAALMQGMGGEISGQQQDMRQETGDTWDLWVEYLDELESHAYFALVEIHYHPDTWPEEWEYKVTRVER